MIEELKNALKENKALPFLFIGAGISRRYLDTPDWPSLLKSMLSSYTDLDSYGTITLQANQLLEDNEKELLLPMIASIIEDQFNNEWIHSDKFSDNRLNENQRLINGEIFSPFKLEVCKLLDRYSLTTDPNLLHEIEILKSLDSNSIAGVITTNYDTFIEDNIFKTFQTFIGEEELLFSDMFGLDEIYKIHGCVTNPEDIVINYKDYQSMIQNKAYLAAKLLTIFVEHPVIFMGYSFSDYNIEQLLTSISNCLSDSKLDQLNKRLFFIERDVSLDEDSYLIEQHYIHRIPLTRIRVNNYGLVYETVKSHRARYNPTLFKILKNSIFDVVKSNDPSKSIFVSEVDITDANIDKIEAIIGFAANRQRSAIGILGVTSEQIYEDIVFDTEIYKNQDSEIIVKSLNKNAASCSWSLPVYKYKESILLFKEDENFLSLLGMLNVASSDHFIPKSLMAERKRFLLKNSSVTSLDELITLYTDESILIKFHLVPLSICDIPTIEKILKTYSEFLRINKYKSSYKRLVKIYDYLKYN